MISVLIPAYNESARIGDTITALRTLPYELQIVVIDDGSRDKTAKVAEKAGADVAFRQMHRGKGSALNRALRLSTGEILLLVDADLGTTASEIEKLLRPVLAGEADMTIALFPPNPNGGGFGFVVRSAREGIRQLTGREMQAPLSGQRVLRRSMVKEFGGFAEGWGVEVALTIRALWRNYRVVEIPTQMRHRVTGRNLLGTLHRWRQYRSVRRTLAKLEQETPTNLQAPPKVR
jgi:glycosyltransferase involved in cell wall biosynthesis